MNDFWLELLVWFLGILGTIITGVLVPFLANWLKSKTDNEKLDYAITELSTTVQTCIDYVNQTFVDQLKKDGKFDENNQKEALQLALNKVRDTLSDSATKVLGKNGIDLESIIVTYIESLLYSNKNSTSTENK